MIPMLLLACSDYDFKGINSPAGSEDSAAAANAEGNGSGSDATAEDSGFDSSVFEDPELATEIIYLNSENQLFAWNPGFGKTLIGNFSDPDARMTDIAIDMEGNMYGIASQDLYRIDAQTAEVFWLCTADQYANGLTFVSNGQLLAAGAGIFIIDVNTCNTTMISDGDGFQTAGDVVGIPGERLFWTVNGTAGDGLVEVNPNSGESRLIGYLGLNSLWGVGYAEGLLYAFSSNGDAVVIDPENASVLAVENISGVWWGATTNPVLW